MVSRDQHLGTAPHGLQSRKLLTKPSSPSTSIPYLHMGASPPVQAWSELASRAQHSGFSAARVTVRAPLREAWRAAGGGLLKAWPLLYWVLVKGFVVDDSN